MTFNQVQFAQVVETAKAKAANNRRWIAAIDKAVAGVESGWWIVTELADSVAITTETGKTYFANGVCQCEAFKNGQPCKHRALARLIELYNERETAPVAVSPAATRAALIADIKSTWSRVCPTINLADELMRRFRCNQLEMLSIDLLQGVRAAIAR